jgi:hypothetical protein
MRRAFAVKDNTVVNFVVLNGPAPTGDGMAYVDARPQDDGVGVGFIYHPGQEPRFTDPAEQE